MKVFISYAHRDEEFKRTLDEHLAGLKRKGDISTWNDRCIKPASDWENSIDENLESADIVVLLVSSSFLSSDYCFSIELERALTNHREGSCKVVPVIVRACDWEDLDIGKIQSLPTDAVPVNKWDDEDTAWLDVVKGLKILIDEQSISKKKS